ncbi:hypothetical protein PS1_014425 [Malus domestica]
MAGKKSVVAHKDKPAGRAVLVKRPRQEAEPAVEPSPPTKRVKQMAKKGAREISHDDSQCFPFSRRRPFWGRETAGFGRGDSPSAACLCGRRISCTSLCRESACLTTGGFYDRGNLS